MKPLDFQEFRERVGDLRGKEYWRSLEELSRSDVFDEFFQSEFPQQAIPLSKGFDRRNFMKLMGASVAMAGLTACGRPEEMIVPYVNQPENLVPGKPLFFASSVSLGGYATGVLVESHMGRPTKIEGNPEHPASLGASDAFAQASVLGLYDPDRSQIVRKFGDTSTWGEFVAALQPVLVEARTNGAGLRILTQSITSPSLGAQIHALLAQYPGMKWHQWEAVNRDNVREGGRQAFGGYVETSYRFEKANVVVALSSDFLSDGPGHLRYARDFMSRRRIREGTTSMNRLYAVEASPSSTGSVADHRFVVKPSQIEGIARAIAAGVGVGAATNGAPPWVATVVRDLQANRGASVVVAGDEQPPAVHALVHAINGALGNLGMTVMVTDSVEVAPVNQLESLRELVREMNSGVVRAIVVLGGNPAFDAPADFNFRQAFQRVRYRAHLSSYYDETSMLCQWHVPEMHALESWGDGRAYDGTVTIQQPLIAPLYNGRSVYEVIGALAGRETTAYDAVRNYWKGNAPTTAVATAASPAPANAPASAVAPASPEFEERWRKWLHDGFVSGSAFAPRGATAAAVAVTPPRPAATGIEIELRHDPTIYDGRFANNGWLQELPKPQTKITWDNVALVSPNTAEKIGFGARVRDPLVNEKRTRKMTVQYRGQTLVLPLWVVPGQADDVVTIFFGPGRTHGGQVAKGAGFNTYGFRFSDALHGGGGAQIALTNDPLFPIACTQEHQSIDPKIIGERGIIRAASFEEYRRNPKFAETPHHDEGHGDTSMYPAFDYSKGHAWAMVIDTSVCVGCAGCVIACQSENNIPIVGKEEVVREREMHWLRIDRYFKGTPDNPEIYHQPVPCMHCETAPCEPVCPVEATSHSEEGLNEMTYNRCVGTRYCSNNCPYKVRRFNFFGYADYNTASLKPMRNPDVTVRTRGVMEKCTYCVQRVNQARIEAEKEGRRVRDGEVTTACAQACPTQAIVFGDMNDKSSEVAKLKAQPTHYALLDELNTKPRTTYLATVRNPNPELEDRQVKSEPAAH